ADDIDKLKNTLFELTQRLVAIELASQVIEGLEEKRRVIEIQITILLWIAAFGKNFDFGKKKRFINIPDTFSSISTLLTQLDQSIIDGTKTEIEYITRELSEKIIKLKLIEDGLKNNTVPVTDELLESVQQLSITISHTSTIVQRQMTSVQFNIKEITQVIAVAEIETGSE
ncbi:unnamed protein product, partial [Meganyctiphanes norvegica]